jgi:1,2-diacylglycerol 3-alpha-glucosyltransferase
MVRQLSKYRLKNVAKVIAPTSKVEDALREYGVTADIAVVPSGISLEQHHYRLSEEERIRKRRELGIPDNHNVLLNLGRLGTEKNLRELLSFFADELQHDPYLTFLIVGDGPDKENLEKQAKELGISSHVIFTGMVNPAEVQFYYQLADIFVNASTSETQGLTYIEAAANGLPLLCRKDPCLDDVLQDGINGYEYTCCEEFEEYLNDMLMDAEWRKTASEQSEKIAEIFGKEHFVESVETIYEEVAV